VHADARGRGALAHDDHVLARSLSRSRAPARVPGRGPVAIVPLTEFEPLALLFERDESGEIELPAELRRLYGGDLALPDECLYANFVATIDGVVAIPSLERSNALISGGDPADRFVMGLLRAAADAVLVGWGTVSASPKGRWRPETVFPPAAEDFRELRKRLGHEREAARVAVVTGRGSLNPEHPVVRDGALVITTQLGADRLSGRLSDAAELAVVAGDDAVDVGAAVALLRERGHHRILSEAGPRLFASLVAADLVDQLFLTVSPLLVGRAPGEERLAIVEGVALLPEREHRGSLRSARLHGEHLFLRYAFP
jgi:riboflavin biosynthesis pyrimidine reductase